MKYYRVNYGNGYVSERCTLAKAKASLQLLSCGHAYIQRLNTDTDEWFRCNPKTGRFLATKRVRF